MKRILLFVAAATVVYFGCKNAHTSPNQTAAAANPTLELPKTPEDVVRTWEAQVGKNDFALAKLISTGESLKAVVSLDSTNHIEAVPTLNTKILNIACSETGDKATCDCLLEDEEGRIQCKYFLIRQNGQWLLSDADSKPVEEKINQKPVK